MPARFAGEVLQFNVEHDRPGPGVGERLGGSAVQGVQQAGEGGEVAQFGLSQGAHGGAHRRRGPRLDVGRPHGSVMMEHDGAIGAQPGVDLGPIGSRLQRAEHGADAVLRLGVVRLQPVAPVRYHQRRCRPGHRQRRYASARKP